MAEEGVVYVNTGNQAHFRYAAQQPAALLCLNVDHLQGFLREELVDELLHRNSTKAGLKRILSVQHILLLKKPQKRPSFTLKQYAFQVS